MIMSISGSNGEHQLNAAFEKYCDWLCRQPLSCNTIRAYVSLVRQFIGFTCKRGLSLSASRGQLQDHIEAYKHYIQELGAQPSSVNNSLIAIEHFLTSCEIYDIKIDRAVRSHPTPAYLTDEEQVRFVASANANGTERDRALALLFLYTGLRVGECSNLNLADVRQVLSASSIVVRKSLSNANASLKQQISREIPLNSQVQLALSDWMPVRADDDRTEIFGNAKGSDLSAPLFTTRGGKRMSLASMDIAIRTIGWKANLSLSCRTLRNTFLRNLLVCSNDRILVARLGGYRESAVGRWNEGATVIVDATAVVEMLCSHR